MSAIPQQVQYQSRWRRRPTWPVLRFVDGQEEVLLAVGEPMTFEAPQGPKQEPALRHLVNVVRIEDLTAAVPTTTVWEMSDAVYRNIQVDPREFWIRGKRHGRGKRGTRYEIKVERKADEKDLRCAAVKHPICLKLVATETRARYQRRDRRS